MLLNLETILLLLWLEHWCEVKWLITFFYSHFKHFKIHQLILLSENASAFVIEALGVTHILCPLLFKIGNCWELWINPNMRELVCLWIFKCDFAKNLSPWWFAVSAAGQSNYRVIPQGNIRKSCHFSSFLEWRFYCFTNH